MTLGPEVVRFSGGELPLPAASGPLQHVPASDPGSLRPRPFTPPSLCLLPAALLGRRLFLPHAPTFHIQTVAPPPEALPAPGVGSSSSAPPACAATGRGAHAAPRAWHVAGPRVTLVTEDPAGEGAWRGGLAQGSAWRSGPALPQPCRATSRARGLSAVLNEP